MAISGDLLTVPRDDGGVWMWDVGNQLTEQEWSRFVPERPYEQPCNA